MYEYKYIYIYMYVYIYNVYVYIYISAVKRLIASKISFCLHVCVYCVYLCTYKHMHVNI